MGRTATFALAVVVSMLAAGAARAETPLHKAAAHGDLVAVKTLIGGRGGPESLHR